MHSGIQAPGSKREQKRLLDSLNEMLQQGRTARKPFEAEWYMNLAFFQGEHWWSWARDRFGIEKMAKWKVLFTDNRVQPAVLMEVAKLTKNRPTWEAVPTSPDENATQDAILSKRVLEAKWGDLGLQPKLRRVATWSRVCGAGFLKATWDPDALDGSEVALGQDGEPMVSKNHGGLVKRSDMPAELHGDVKWQKVGRGDVCVNVRSPFDIYVDPFAGDEGMDSVSWLIEEKVRDPQSVADQYGVSKPAADSEASVGLIEAIAPGQATQGAKVGVRVFELWQKPSGEFPRGRHAAWCDGKLLAYGDNPTKGGAIPYDMFTGVPVPGRFWPSSMTTQIRPLNAELDKTRSQMRENANRMGNPALLVPKELADAGFQYSGFPGEQIPYDAYSSATPPSFLTPPGIPRSVTEEVSMIENSIREVSHQFEVSRGQVPAGVTAASAIQLLQEADQTIIAMDAQDFEDAISRVGRRVLDLVAKFYKQPRLLQTAGEDETFDLFTFKSDQLSRDVPTVQVKPGSMIPRSVAARQALMEHMLTLFLQNGVQLDPVALGDFLRQFEIGGLEALVAGFSDDSRKVAAENKQLADLDQDPPAVNDWDNHAAEIRGHEREMKTKRFELAPDDVKQRFVKHWESHKDTQMALALKDAEKQATMQAQIAAAQGGGGSPPAPSGPGGPDLSGGAEDAIAPQPGGAAVEGAPADDMAQAPPVAPAAPPAA